MAKQKKKTEEKPEPKPEPKRKTVKEKIDDLVDSVSEGDKINKEELKKKLFHLVQRLLYPDQFCPECDERLFFTSNTGYNCPNCGFQRGLTTTSEQPAIRPSQTGQVPEPVEKVIQQAEQNMREPRRVVAPTTKGQQIRKLVDQMDSGGPSAPTPQDEAAVRRDKNVGRQINWV